MSQALHCNGADACCIFKAPARAPSRTGHLSRILEHLRGAEEVSLILQGPAVLDASGAARGADLDALCRAVPAVAEMHRRRRVQLRSYFARLDENTGACTCAAG
jgi:hypothetical protein